MDLFSIVASVVVAVVGGALSWALKRGADQSGSASIEILMDQLDQMLWSTIIPAVKPRIRDELKEYETQPLENKYVHYVLTKLETMAPKVIKKLGFTAEGLEEYVRESVQKVIEDLTDK